MKQPTSTSKPHINGLPASLAVLLSMLSILTPAFPLAFQMDAKQSEPLSAPKIGAFAPRFDLTALDGRAIGLDLLRGRPLILNFFASWCDPCREEMPVIKELAAKSQQENYNVIGIAVEDTRASVTLFAKEVKLDFPLALDLNSRVKRSYRIFGPPATYFIDAQGIIRDIVFGPLTVERAKKAMKTILMKTILSTS